MRRNPFAGPYPAQDRNIRAISTTPTVLTVLAVLAGLYLLRLVPSDGLQQFLLNLSFEPLRFLALILGYRLDPWLPAALSPVTHALLHVDFVHLAVNSGCLLAFGTEIERRLGGLRFLLLAAVCAIAGAMAVELRFLIVEQPVIVIGASGAVSGLFGALVRGMRSHRLLLVTSFLVVNIAIGMTGIPGSEGVMLVAWDAHVGGFFAGFLLYPLFRYRRAAG